MICHRGVILVKTISYIFTSLVACHVRTNRPLYFIMQFTWIMVRCHDDSSRRNLFLEDYPISASLFVFRGSNTKLFFGFYLLYCRDMLWHHRNMKIHQDSRRLNDITSHTCTARTHGNLLTPLDIVTPHVTSDIRPPNDNTSFSHRLWSQMCRPPPTLTSSLRSSARTLGHACLYKGVICTCHPWFCSCLSFILRLSQISSLVFALVERVKSYIMDRCNYSVPHTSWMVEMPINGRQYHQMIASLWISHLIDNLPLSPVKVAHIACAQLTNPRQISSQPGIIVSRLSQVSCRCDLIFHSHF